MDDVLFSLLDMKFDKELELTHHIVGKHTLRKYYPQA